MLPNDIQVVAFSLEDRWADLSDGQRIPITNMFGPDKEETDDPDLTVSFVSGPTVQGTWLATIVAAFEPATLQ